MSILPIKIVLVETSHPGNIGAVARSMKNMGFSELYLVSPKDFPSKESYDRASGASDVLDNAVICTSLDEAIADCHYIAMTTARTRHAKWQFTEARDAAKEIHELSIQHKTALVFGPERTGLSNEDLEKSHIYIHIPTTEFSSLNLSMAVNLMCYELYMSYLQSNPNNPPADSELQASSTTELATQSELEGFYQHLHQSLEDIEFYNNKAPEKMMRKLRHIFQRAHLDKDEVHILRGILSRFAYKLKRY